MRTDREVGVYVTRGDEVLVLHRRGDDYWHVVAGVVEEGETFAEAAARELAEEAGLRTTSLRDLELHQSYVVPDEVRSQYREGTTTVGIESFTIEVEAAWEPVLNEEHDVHRWCALHDAIALVKWPETKAALARLRR